MSIREDLKIILELAQISADVASEDWRDTNRKLEAIQRVQRYFDNMSLGNLDDIKAETLHEAWRKLDPNIIRPVSQAVHEEDSEVCKERKEEGD